MLKKVHPRIQKDTIRLIGHRGSVRRTMTQTNQALSKDQNQLAEELLKICQRMSWKRDLPALLDLKATEPTKLWGRTEPAFFCLIRNGASSGQRSHLAVRKFALMLA